MRGSAINTQRQSRERNIFIHLVHYSLFLFFVFWGKGSKDAFKETLAAKPYCGTGLPATSAPCTNGTFFPLCVFFFAVVVVFSQLILQLQPSGFRPFCCAFCGQTQARTNTPSPPQIKGCGHIRNVAAFLVPGRDNRTVCGTHVPQQSTEQPFEEAPSHGRCGLDTIRHSVTPASLRRTFTSVNSHFHCGCGSSRGLNFFLCVCHARQTSKYEQL